MKEILLLYKEKLQKEFNLIPVLGCELEFYATGPVQKLAKLGLDLVEEDGHNQFEIRFCPTDDIFQLLGEINVVKKNLKECGVTFAAKPFEHQPGSALQMHLNFGSAFTSPTLRHPRERGDPGTNNPPKGSILNLTLEEKNGPLRGNYLFLDPRVREDDVGGRLDHAIGGLLHTLPDLMIFFAPNEDSYKRFAAKSMTSPTTISWGPNNRTAALRLLKDFNKVPRIEHRVAGADADPLAVATAILFGAYIGIKEELNPSPPTWGLTFDPQYNLALLPISLDEAKKNFTKSRFSSMFASLA